MALITRVSRLFRADLNAILDRIEEPDIVLKQALRDMQEELDRDQRRIESLQAERTRCAAHADSLTQAMSRFEEELDICFDAKNEDLARSLVRRKLEAERSAQALTQHQSALTRSLEQLQAKVGINNSRLQAMQQQAEVGERDENAGSVDCAQADPFTAHATVRDEDVEVAFLREKQSRVQS